ncbi:MAG: Hsp20/alpha crystallin family protein [Candidatus Marinimicrobia bacterium]|nr:Hsp20/alpha crystallin family protein [Candidatus Neomarinimicrobiota bacterium]
MSDKKAITKKAEAAPAEAVELLQNRAVFVPATDIYEDEKAIVVVCDVPGVEESQVNVALENHVLTLIAPQAVEATEGFECLHRGYRTGVYRRTFNIPEDIDSNRISAQLKQGVLRVTLPKAEAAKPRAIKVESVA